MATPIFAITHWASGQNSPWTTTNTALDRLESVLGRAVNAQTGTTYTFDWNAADAVTDPLGDAAKFCTFDNASAITATIDTNANQAFPVGTELICCQIGAGALTVQGAGGVTVNGSAGGSVVSDGQFAWIVAQKIATDTWVVRTTSAPGGASSTPWDMTIAVSDETTDLTTGTAKVTFRMPRAVTLTDVRASVNTAPTGSTIIVDINEGGTTILSTKLSIDASEKTSTTAATPPVISDSALADDAEITIDIDQIGSSTAGKGLKVTLIGTV